MKRSLVGRAAVLVLPLGALVCSLAALPVDDWRWGYPRLSGWLLCEWLTASVVAAALFLLVTAAIGKRLKRVVDEAPWRAVRSLARYSPAVCRSRTALPKVELPNFGLYCGWLLMVLIVIFWVLGTPRAPTGLFVRVASLYVAQRPRVPESESLGVYVRFGGRGYVFYVNGRPVPRDQLRARLQEELGRRSMWTVYFEADDEVAYGEVVYVIDTIRGLGAQAYWLTPRVRDEFSQAQRTKR